MDLKSAENMDFDLALDWMIEEYKKVDGEEKCYLHDAIVFLLRYKKLIEEQHQIVRCKDCKNRNDSLRCPLELLKEQLKYTRVFTYDLPDDWFCADGERRSENE